LEYEERVKKFFFFNFFPLDDPLMAEIAQEYQGNYRKFEEIAKDWTSKFAIQVCSF